MCYLGSTWFVDVYLNGKLYCDLFLHVVYLFIHLLFSLFVLFGMVMCVDDIGL